MHSFGSKWVQITHFPQDVFSGKIDCYYCVPAVLYLTKAFQKNSQRPNHQKGCITLSQIWSELTFPSKTNLLEKLSNISLVFYIPLCYIISKKLSESRSWGCITFAEIAAVCHKREFSWKIDWCPTIALHCAKMFLKISRAVN